MDVSGRGPANLRQTPRALSPTKNPPFGGFLIATNKPEGLLDLAFLVHHVLPDDGVVLADLHLVRRVLLVLVGGVEVAGAGRGDQTDLVALACHVVLLRPFRRVSGVRPERCRCRSCRWCAARARKPSA